MIVGMRMSKTADHLVGIHVGGSAAPRLENVDHELIVMFALDDFFSRALDRVSEIHRQLSQPPVHPRSRALDQSQRTDKGSRKSQLADRKVLDGALCLSAI